MKKKLILLVVIGMMLAGCGTVDTAPGKTSEIEGEAASDAAPGSISDSSGEGSAPGEASAGGSGVEPRERRYVWQEFEITLPEEWVGRCVMKEQDGGFSIYQKASYEKSDVSGYICSFFCTPEPVEYDHGKTLIAYTEDGMLYYMSEPSDVACDVEDERIVGEYIRMCQQLGQVKASLRITAPGAHCNADEYMLSTSSILPLDQAELSILSDNNLWIARNEIYARHGRMFANEYLQQYFNRCTWYEGTVPPQEFQESVLNQTERDNLQLLAAAEEEYDRQHPYPKKYQMSETVREDLDGDGKAEEISCQVTAQGNGEAACVITINGERFPANELCRLEPEGGMTDPVTDCFYITDILESDGTLEIAILDEGPSEDPVTYFFRYDGALSCIGQVSGFPFADWNNGWNGFDGYGGIYGRLRIDLIETAYLRCRRWYDGSRIIDLGGSWYDFLPSAGHALYEDLPVYCEWDETSAVTVIPAQEVFFLGTDQESWILVKGKDGSQGYMLLQDGMIVGLDKPVEEVFSGLQFSG